MSSLSELHYSTYSRAILTELESLCTIIRKFSLTKRDESKKIKDTTPLLSMEQIKVALTNPQNSLKSSMHAYATMLKLHRDILSLREQVLLQKRMAKEGMEELREKYANATGEGQKEELSQAMIDLENSAIHIQQLQQTIADLADLLESHKNKVDALIKECDNQWTVFRNHYIKKLDLDLKQANIELTEIEIKDLHEQETWPELLNRFKEQHLEIPPSLHAEEPNFATYFKLKGYLAIHASLSRRMLPNTPNDILKIVKQLLKG